MLGQRRRRWTSIDQLLGCVSCLYYIIIQISRISMQFLVQFFLFDTTENETTHFRGVVILVN